MKTKLSNPHAKPGSQLAENELPLTPDEISPKSGPPAMWQGVDIGSCAAHYLHVVHGLPIGEGQPAKELGELMSNEEHSTMMTNLKLLEEHDLRASSGSKADSRLEKHVLEKYGKAMGRTTIRTRVVHARFFLVLGIGGLIHHLPNQTQCLVIFALPRDHWGRFCEFANLSPAKKVDNQLLKCQLAEYALMHGLPLGVVPAGETSLSANAGEPGAEGSLSEHELESRRWLAEQIAATLHDDILESARQAGIDAGAAFVEEIQSGLGRREQAEKFERQRQQFLLIAESDSTLCDQIFVNAGAAILLPAEERLKRRIRAASQT